MQNINDLLQKEHLEDLRKSELSDNTILIAKIQTVSIDILEEELGYRPKDAKSAYRIPYPRTDFCRYRIFYDANVEK